MRLSGLALHSIACLGISQTCRQWSCSVEPTPGPVIKHAKLLALMKRRLERSAQILPGLCNLWPHCLGMLNNESGVGSAARIHHLHGSTKLRRS